MYVELLLLLVRFDWPHQTPNNLPPVDGSVVVIRSSAELSSLNCSSSYDEQTILTRENGSSCLEIGMEILARTFGKKEFCSSIATKLSCMRSKHAGFITKGARKTEPNN